MYIGGNTVRNVTDGNAKHDNDKRNENQSMHEKGASISENVIHNTMYES